MTAAMSARRRARLRAKSAAAHQPFGRFGGFRRQLKARDPRIAPGDRAEAHGRLKDMIVLSGLAHCIASGFVTKERCAVEPQIQPDSCFGIRRSQTLAPASAVGRIISASALRIAVLGTPNSPP